jgi:hypothetical protein
MSCLQTVQSPRCESHATLTTVAVAAAEDLYAPRDLLGRPAGRRQFQVLLTLFRRQQRALCRFVRRDRM